VAAVVEDDLAGDEAEVAGASADLEEIEDDVEVEEDEAPIEDEDAQEEDESLIEDASELGEDEDMSDVIESGLDEEEQRSGARSGVPPTASRSTPPRPRSCCTPAASCSTAWSRRPVPSATRGSRAPGDRGSSRTHARCSCR
jgi:hypothetical protein